MKNTLRRIAKRAAITGGLRAAGVMKAAGLMGALKGRGAIFTLHHVRPKVARGFDPNAHLEITPAFLGAALTRLKQDGYRFLSLEGLPAHLASGDQQPVAVFTLDDGYRNNLEHAAPVFARHGAPFTVFVAGGFIDRTRTLWWETLADLLEAKHRLDFDFGHGNEALVLETVAQKQAAFDRIAGFVHGQGESGLDEAQAVARIDDVARLNGIDPLGITGQLTLDESGLRDLVRSPLASLGVHTVSHRALARLSGDAAQAELTASADRIEQITGKRPSTLAYPYGDRTAVSVRDQKIASALGLIAVTTQPGTIATTADLSALPRISLNGFYQKPAHVSALASGIPFKLMARGG